MLIVYPYTFVEVSVHFFPCFKDFFLFYLIFKVFYIFCIQTLPQIYGYNFFSQYVTYIFICLYGSLGEQELLISIVCYNTFFLLKFMLFVPSVVNLCLIQGSKYFLLSPYGNTIISVLMFWSVLYDVSFSIKKIQLSSYPRTSC